MDHVWTAYIPVVAFSNVSFRTSVILFVCVSRVCKRTPLSKIAYLTCRCRRSSSMASTPRKWTRCKLRRSRTIRSTSAAWPGPCAGESTKHPAPYNMNIWNKRSSFPTLYLVVHISGGRIFLSICSLLICFRWIETDSSIPAVGNAPPAGFVSLWWNKLVEQGRKGTSLATVNGRNPKQPPGMYKTYKEWDKLPTSTG